MCWWTKKTNLPWVEINIRKDRIRSVVHSKISFTKLQRKTFSYVLCFLKQDPRQLMRCLGGGGKFLPDGDGESGRKGELQRRRRDMDTHSHSSDGDCKPGGAGWGRCSQAAVGLKGCFAPCYLVTISKLGTDQGRVPSQVSQPPQSLGFHTQ